jgi:hypothetical protein
MASGEDQGEHRAHVGEEVPNMSIDPSQHVVTQRPLGEQTTSPGRSREPRWRRAVIRAVYGLFSLWALMMSAGFAFLVTVLASGGSDDLPAALYFAAAGTTAWKLLSLGSVLIVCWTGGRSIVAVQSIVVGIACWAVADVVAPQDPTRVGASAVLSDLTLLAILVVPWLVCAASRREILHVRAQPDRVALLGSLVAVPLLAWWASTTAGTVVTEEVSEMGPGAMPAELRFDMVGLAVALALVGLWSALRPRGRRWLLVAMAAATGYTALFAVARPHDAASPGYLGAGLLLCWCALLVWRASRPLVVPEHGAR